ncbi:MAG: YjfB family protein [Desulfosporosinus sp.]|nr:YjfB family protein [Desulfosporosinus sp.]
MDIANMSVAFSQNKVQQQAGISVLKMALGVEATKGDSIASLASVTTKAMELSVQSNLGANLDIGA